MDQSNAALRDRLQRITGGGEVQADAHPTLLSALASEIPHSIIAVPHLAPDLPIHCYNCFEFAFGLAGRNEVRLISHFIPSTCCNGVFAKCLAASILIPTASLGADGDLVLYHDNQQFTHAGLVRGGRILSKWALVKCGCTILWRCRRAMAKFLRVTKLQILRRCWRSFSNFPASAKEMHSSITY